MRPVRRSHRPRLSWQPRQYHYNPGTDMRILRRKTFVRLYSTAVYRTWLAGYGGGNYAQRLAVSRRRRVVNLAGRSVQYWHACKFYARRKAHAASSVKVTSCGTTVRHLVFSNTTNHRFYY